MTTSHDPAVVTVVGVGRARITPDIALLSLGVRVQADSPAAALASCSQGIRAVLERIGSRVETTQSGQLTVRPEFEQGKDGRTFVGYVAESALIVQTRDLDEIGEIAAAALEAAGASGVVHQLSLAVSDSSLAEQEARSAAFEEAKAKAEQYAAMSGRRLGALREVSELASSGGPRKAALLPAAAAGYTPMPVEPGEFQIVAQLSASWLLADE